MRSALMKVRSSRFGEIFDNAVMWYDFLQSSLPMVAMPKGNLVYFRLNFLGRNMIAVLMTGVLTGIDGVPPQVIMLTMENGDFVQTEVHIFLCLCHKIVI